MDGLASSGEIAAKRNWNGILAVSGLRFKSIAIALNLPVMS